MNLWSKEVIDIELKGNLVRFYLGKNGSQWGDDWDDVPYEHNAGRVYLEYVDGWCDVAFKFDVGVIEPCYLEKYEDVIRAGNSKLSKKDMIMRVAPCLVVGEEDFMYIESLKYEEVYFGDKIAEVLCKLSNFMLYFKFEENNKKEE